MKQDTVTLTRTKTVDGKDVCLTAKGVPNNPEAIAKASVVIDRMIATADATNMKINSVSLVKRIGSFSFVYMKNQTLDEATFVLFGFGLRIPYNEKGGKFGLCRTSWKDVAVLSTNKITTAFRWSPKKITA